MMIDSRDEPRDPENAAFSLVRDDLCLRAQRRVGLIPAQGLGVVRRACFWSLLAWLPIALWALGTGRAITAGANEPLLSHFGIHTRFLIAVPLMIMAEGLAHATLARVMPWFLASGVVPPREAARFRAMISRAARLRDASTPWVAILGLVLADVTVVEMVHHAHEVDWTTNTGAGLPRFGFAAWWFLYVGRPIYLTLMLGWIWRAILLFLLFRGIARLDLSLVPAHPDQMGGLGFLVDVPTAFAPVVLAVGAVLAGIQAHDVVYHQVTVASLRIEMIAFVFVSTLVFLLPMLAFAPPLARARRQALLEYGALVCRHGRLVRERWIEGRAIEGQEILQAPELGSCADVSTLHDAVRAMRTVPLTKTSVASLLIAAAAPMIAVLALEVPVGQLLLSLLKALI